MLCVLRCDRNKRVAIHFLEASKHVNQSVHCRGKAILLDFLRAIPGRFDSSPVLKQLVDCAQEKLLETELERAAESFHNAVKEKQPASFVTKHKPRGMRFISKLIDHVLDFADRKRIAIGRKETIGDEMERSRLAVACDRSVRHSLSTGCIELHKAHSQRRASMEHFRGSFSQLLSSQWTQFEIKIEQMVCDR